MRAGLKWFAIASVGLWGACAESGSAGDSGALAVTIGGEAAAEEGFPVGAGESEIAFVDGFEVTFDSILVSVLELTVAEEGAAGSSVTLDAPLVVELTTGSQEVGFWSGLRSGRYAAVGYTIGPVQAASTLLGEVSETDLAEMQAEGVAIWIRGSATDGTDTYTLDLRFAETVRQLDCVNGLDGTSGLVVTEGGTTTVDLTIHLDHLWFDTYAAEEANLRFEPWAATADADGHIELEFLSAQELGDLTDRAGEPLTTAGETLVVYDPGTLDLTSFDLESYVRAAATTMGHFNGEGHCEYVVE